MKFIADNIKLQYNDKMQSEIILSTKGNAFIDVAEMKAIIAKGKELVVEIKQYRHKRSLDSNAYLWVLLNEMATVLKTNKDELYLEVLSRYGVFTHVIVKPEIVSRVIEQWRTARELGEVTINGKTGIQIQCYFGSSSYNTAEMSKLLEGVVSEAKELGVNTVTPKEMEQMHKAWGV